MEAKDAAVSQEGFGDGTPGGRSLGYWVADGNRVRRALWDEPATQGEALYSSEAVPVCPAFICRNTGLLPRETAGAAARTISGLIR